MAEGMVAAKRGDLVVIGQHRRDYVLHGESREYDEFEVGVVTSVTREGVVKAWCRAGDHLQLPLAGQRVPPQAMSAVVRVLVRSKALIDVPGALATAACHAWPTGNEPPMPYGSLEEVRAAMRPHAGTRREELRAAVTAWEAARREAAPLLTEAVREPWKDWEKYERLIGKYRSAITAANEAYRAAVAKVSAEPAAA